MSDTKETEGYTTVELTLDNDEVIECAILTEDGEPDLGNIEDDEEYEIAADAFDEWMDSQEFDESDIEE